MAKNRRFKPLPIIIGAIIIIILCLIISGTKREAISSKEIIEKENWTKDEIVDTMAMLSVQRKRNSIRIDVLSHMRKQIRKLPEESRREVLKKTVLKSIDKIQEQWSSLDDEKRKGLIKAIHWEAKRNHSKVKYLSDQKRKELKKVMSERSTKEWINEVNQKMANSLSPEARKELSPIIKEWVATLENL